MKMKWKVIFEGRNLNLKYYENFSLKSLKDKWFLTDNLKIENLGKWDHIRKDIQREKGKNK